MDLAKRYQLDSRNRVCRHGITVTQCYALESLVDRGGALNTDLAPGLSTALDYRAEIHQAQGMVVVDLDVGPAEALTRMRVYAFSQDRPLLDLAHDTISGLKLPVRD